MSTTNSFFGRRTRLALSVSDIFPQPKLQAHAQQPDVCHPPGPAAVAPALSLQPAAFLVLTQTPPRATNLFCWWLRVMAFPSLAVLAVFGASPRSLVPAGSRLSIPREAILTHLGILSPPWPALSPALLLRPLIPAAPAWECSPPRHCCSAACPLS